MNLDITPEMLQEIRTQVVGQLHELVDSLTRPGCTGAAGFTKRRAADLKAGITDGATSALAEVLRLARAAECP